jgi:hypothetical protein
MILLQLLPLFAGSAMGSVVKIASGFSSFVP